MARCMSRALASPFRTHVVSINWSQDVITTVLSETLLENHRWVVLKILFLNQPLFGKVNPARSVALNFW